MDVLVVLFWSLIGSVLSLVGGVILLKVSSKRDILLRYAMPFGAGAMLTAALIGMLPEATHSLGIEAAAPWVLGGFVIFFILERGLGWFHHHHHHHHHYGEHTVRNRSHTSLIIIGDTLHNAIDGVALGAAFVIGPEAGIGVALAVLAHEVPQEIGDFGLLLAKGMRPSRVLLVSFISALATVATALITYLLGSSADFDVAPLLAIAAGLFLYVAAADIVPDIHERPHAEAPSQIILFLAGVVVVGAVIIGIPHGHDGGYSDHEYHQEDSDSNH